jgi:hypothetical protein
LTARFLAALALCLALSGAAAAAETPCRSDARLVGACFAVHGRITVRANMRPYLWPLGSRRLIGIASPDGAIVMPAEIEQVFATPAGFDKAVFGDFTVCPFTRQRPGIMQLACIEAVKHLTVRNRQP